MKKIKIFVFGVAAFFLLNVLVQQGKTALAWEREQAVLPSIELHTAQETDICTDSNGKKNAEVVATDSNSQTPATGSNALSLAERINLTNPDRELNIEAIWQTEKLSLGDEITLVADISGYEGLDYRVFWEVKRNDVWESYGDPGKETCSFILDKENMSWKWRAGIEILVDTKEE